MRAVNTHSTAASGRAVASDRSANSVPVSAQWMSSSTIASGIWAAAEPPSRRSASASPTGGSARRGAMNSDKNGTVC